MDEKLWISLIGLSISALTFFIGRTTATKQEGEKSGYLASDIGYIKAGIDDLKTEIRAIKLEVAEMNTRVTRLEEQSRIAFSRIEILEKSAIS